MKKAVVAGHICLDITPTFERNISTKHIFDPGNLTQVGKADIHTGGAVANTGLAMKKMGIETMLMGLVGDDAFGKIVLSILSDFNSEKQMIVSPTTETSYSVVLAPPGIDRIFYHNPGANNVFGVDSLDYEKIAEADLFHFGYPPLMANMFADRGKQLEKIFKTVHDMKLITSLDLAMVDENSSAGKADWINILKRTLPYVDIFLPSFEELCFMLDKEKYDYLKQKAGNTDISNILHMDDIESLAKKALDLGAENIIIKCGAPGLYYSFCNAQNLADKLNLPSNEWQNKKGFEYSYVPERVLSGTGAGDTTIAGFLSAMLLNYSLKNCLHLAAASGASCVSTLDALSGIIDLETQMSHINNAWKKTEVKLC